MKEGKGFHLGAVFFLLMGVSAGIGMLRFTGIFELGGLPGVLNRFVGTLGVGALVIGINSKRRLPLPKHTMLLYFSLQLYASGLANGPILNLQHRSTRFSQF